MGKATYEFRYVSTKQKVQLVLCKAFVIMLMLMFLTMLAVKGKPDYGQDLVFISGVMNCCFAYINLMRVRVEVPELFEHPVQFTGAEFFFGRFLLDGPDR
jgi:hypothetical protein|tara:strand:- start:13 stop:312 length:300 start_codon:yes stop_codon:yes gene_type:complete